MFNVNHLAGAIFLVFLGTGVSVAGIMFFTNEEER